MRCLHRNKVRFFYALYDKKEEIIDEYGNMTGEYAVTHSNPVECYGNISAARGEMATCQFGENEAYDRILVLDNASPKIDEYTVLWVDTIPTLNKDGTLRKNSEGEVDTPYDYIVKKVALSLNSVSIAIRKVNVCE